MYLRIPCGQCDYTLLYILAGEALESLFQKDYTALFRKATGAACPIEDKQPLLFTGL